MSAVSHIRDFLRTAMRFMHRLSTVVLHMFSLGAACRQA
jgi:hypothetical protein